ncbi:MAG: dihydropteroate synthase [Paracoccaceae bacterium]|jgi:dihydropteroate synthase|nr:dihydropteroate synthase [Paracoccaceae bacterium]MDP7184099.1 dihydropteroate synthase [Paracoccaceae bacterium]
MTQYFRPIVSTDTHRPKDAQALAGGWAWFTHVEVMSRDGAGELLPATDIPPAVLTRLTAKRPPIAKLAFDSPSIMGILNVTPDSFSDGGRFNDTDIGERHAQAMIQAGADIIDIGGESTRPGAAEVPAADEAARTVPVIEAIRASSDIPISIDTRKASVARKAIAAGANLINDVSAFSFDPSLTSVANQTDTPVCLMHAQGDPETMQNDPYYANVLLDVYDYLQSRVEHAVAHGIARDRIIVDPGIGFGKTLDHNLRLLKGLSLFHGLGCPILLGVSRKRFIGTIGDAPKADMRAPGSIAVALAGVSQGVQIIRVHDVAETSQALKLHMALTG